MAFTRQQPFSKKTTDLPDVPSPTYTATQIKEYIETPSDENKTFVDGFIDEIEAETGAGNIGSEDTDGNPSTVQAETNKANNGLNTHKTATTLDHPDKSVTEPKMADSSVSRRTIQSGAVGTNEIDPSIMSQPTTAIGVQAKFDSIDSQLADIVINVKTFGAKGDGVTDDTEAIQAALDHIASLYGGDVTSAAGYIGWHTPILAFPNGVYKCGLVTTPSKIKIVGLGKAVIQSLTGTLATPAGKLVNNTITNLHAINLTFLFYDQAFITPTGNADMSFITFEECGISHINTFIDTVDFPSSRSTTFKMAWCTVSYSVTTLCKLFTDKAYFEGNWFNHSTNSTFMYLDSYAVFKDNVWVPTNTGANKAYIDFSGSDNTRSLIFTGERFGSEDGSCPIVIVRDVNKNNGNNSYRNQGITFNQCFMASNASYDPDGVGAVRSNVILRPTLGPSNSMDYIKFNDCVHTPDLSGGVVQTYNVADISTRLSSDFVIDFDYPSAISGTKGVNKLAGNDLMRYVNTPLIVRKTHGSLKTGKIVAVDTATAGQKKATFTINRTWPNSYHTPIAFLVTCIGEGDSSYNNFAYSYSSIYLLTISGQNTSSNFSNIKFTKLHGDVGGASNGANADIISAHFGDGDTGSSTQALTGTQTDYDITIAFGTRVNVGTVYVKPLFDFSLLT